MGEKADYNLPEDSEDGMDNVIMISTLIIGLILIVLLFIWKRRSTSRTDILITGLCEAGKTVLFTQLLGDCDIKETYTSTVENVAEYQSTKGALRLVDIPGHERVRSKFFDQYKNAAKGIVFVIDSVTFQRDVRDVADYLYTILADSAISSIPILILCNKQDETMAKGSSVVESLLEKEMNLVRTTRTNQLKAVDNSSTDANAFLGKQGKDFDFSQVSQTIQLVEGSALKNDLDNLTNWLEKFA